MRRAAQLTCHAAREKWRRHRILAAGSARALRRSRPRKAGRRECRMLGAPAAARALVGSTRVSHRRLAETVRHSLRDGLQAYSVLSPECRRSAGLVSLRRLPRRIGPKGRYRQHARLDTSVGVPGPHGFAVRACRARLAPPARPSHPAPASVTIAIRPLRSGMGGDIHLICISEKEKYFRQRALTGIRKISPSGKSVHRLVFRTVHATWHSTLELAGIGTDRGTTG
jgi:hypothetical protein